MKLKKRLGFIFVATAVSPYLIGVLYILFATSGTMKQNAVGFLSEYTANIASMEGAYFEKYTGVAAALSRVPEIENRDWPAVKGYLRITSYNVCYTKLLRIRSHDET